MSIFKRTALTVALLAVAPVAFGATDDDTMTVSIIIENSCAVTANDLSFGTVSDLSSNVDSQTTVSLNCTNQGPVTIEFDDGAGATASFADRQMSDGAGNSIDYSLYRDASRTEVLGDGTGTTVVISATSDGTSAQSFDVFGRVDGGQGAKPVGNYSDSVLATVTF